MKPNWNGWLAGLLLWLFVLPAAALTTQAEFAAYMARTHGFDEMELNRLLNQAVVRQSILDLIARPGEKKPWHEYRKIFLTQPRIDGGVKFWNQWQSWLRKAEQAYGVPAGVIVSIIGVETVYGKNTGSHRVLDALVTLAFHYPKRADFFRDELEAYLLLTRQERLDPLAHKGSYAGAMGPGQFMPSSFLKYAVDFDGNGQRDIWRSMPDVIGSVANYLREFGWQAGGKVALAAAAREDAVEQLAALPIDPMSTLGQLKQQGLLFEGREADATPGIAVGLETEAGMAWWLGLRNFYVITRYNRSPRYAMAVYQLAQAIEYSRHAKR
jgi:membrane-bound lytic murein transglycosylase B